MPDFAVSTTFKANDRITKTFGRMGRGADKFGKSSTRAFRDASRGASRFGDITKGILAAGAVQRGLGLLQTGLSATTLEFLNFDDAITSASAKFKDLDLSTEQGIQTLLDLKAVARTVGADTQFSAGQAASGLDFLAMAGFNAEQSMAALPGVVDLATNAKTDLARATDIASDSLGAFGLMTKDSIKLQANLTRVNDVMALTMARTNTGIEDLFEAVRSGAADFTTAGQSMETFNALAGVMANAGKKGEAAGTVLRNIMVRLAAPTKQAGKLIGEMGIKTKDQAGNFRDVVDILADLEKGLKGKGSAEKTAIISTIFGLRAQAGVNILLKAGIDNIRDFRKELVNSTGASQKMASIMRQSLMNRLKALGSAAIELGFKFFTAFEKMGGGAIDKLTAAVRNFDPTPIITGMKQMVIFTKGLVNVITPFVPLLATLVGGMLAYNIAIKAQMAMGAIKHFISFISVVRTLTGAQLLLGVVMAANPLGAFITAVTVAVGVVALLWKKSALVRQSVMNLVDAFTPLWDIIKLGGGVIGKVFGVDMTSGFKSFASAVSISIDLIAASVSALLTPLKLYIKAARFVGGVFGGNETPPAKAAAPTSPNVTEVKTRQQQIGFNGKLQIAGAPEGSTFESETTGAPPINIEMLGANP
jgi:TP901 family phage tail tape measure protein